MEIMKIPKIITEIRDANESSWIAPQPNAEDETILDFATTPYAEMGWDTSTENPVKSYQRGIYFTIAPLEDETIEDLVRGTHDNRLEIFKEIEVMLRKCYKHHTGKDAKTLGFTINTCYSEPRLEIICQVLG